MAKKKSLEELTSDELYELAKAKEAEERERQREALRTELEETKAELKALRARHRKEQAALEAKIRRLSSRLNSREGKVKGRRGGVSSAVLEILSDNQEHSTKEIKETLASRGIVAANLNQTLAYLKRRGKIKSPAHSVYIAVQ